MGMAAKNNVPTYSATSKLYIVNKDSFGIKMADLQLGTALTSDYQEVFKTWEVHEMVIEELNLPYSYQEMQSMLTVSNPEDTRVLYITVTYPDAKMAADIANSYAKAAKTFISKTMDGVEPSDFSIALEPSVGYSTSVLVSAVIGSVGGGVLAVAILALLFVLDNRPRSPEVIQQYGGIPTLSVLPANKNKRPARKNPSGKMPARKPERGDNYLEISSFQQLDYVSNEAMNTLCTNLSYCGKDIRKIMVTSRYSGEGKSYVSMNLLRTFSQLGKKAVLIDTDLRASGIQSDYRLRYSTQNHYGLSEYLSGIQQSEFLEEYSLTLRQELYHAVSTAKWEQLVAEKQTDTIDLFTSQCSQVSHGVSMIIELLSSVVTALVSLGIALWLSLPVTVFVLILGCGFAWVFRHLMKESKYYGDEMIRINRALYYELYSQLRSIKEVRSYGVQKEHAEFFDEISRSAKDAKLKFMRRQAFPSMLYSSITFAGKFLQNWSKKVIR